MNSSSSDNSCNSGTNNAGSVGSVTSASSKKRTVNFKLDIKPEPLVNSSNSIGGISGDHIDSIHCMSQGILQKVPSISDLSEPESSLDLPVTQVGNEKNCMITLIRLGLIRINNYILYCLLRYFVS